MTYRLAVGFVAVPGCALSTPCATLRSVREQFWFWYGYRPGIRTVARQALR